MQSKSRQLDATENGYPIAISLAFWLCLLVAALLYAAVALSPKLVVWMRLQSEHRANQVRLVELDDQVDHLRKVIDALENDPDFSAELARVALDASRPGDERIPVDESLSLTSALPSRAPDRAAPVLPLYAPFVDVCASDRTVRITLLTLSALMVIASFAFLHDQYEDRLRTGMQGMHRGVRAIISRYRHPAS